MHTKYIVPQTGKAQQLVLCIMWCEQLLFFVSFYFTLLNVAVRRAFEYVLKWIWVNDNEG